MAMGIEGSNELFDSDEEICSSMQLMSQTKFLL